MRVRNLSCQKLSVALRRLWPDSKGIAAVEFAMILPLMVTTYLGVGEISELLSADRKLVTLARALSDLTAQYTTVADTDLATIISVAAPVMVPFRSTTVKMTVSSVVFNTNPSPGGAPIALVDWTATSQGGTPRACVKPLAVVANTIAASPTTVPTGVAIAGSTVIIADVSYPYVPMFGKAIIPGGAITVKQTTYMRPRNVTRVPYTGTTYTNCKANFTG